MSTPQRSLFALALLLGLAFASATPAASQNPDHARGGIWVHTSLAGAWTLTVVNLTNHPLSLVENHVFPVVWSPYSHYFGPNEDQHSPFYLDTDCDANTTPLCLPVAPYRTVTWKSNVQGDGAAWRWGLSFRPQGMDPKWTVGMDFNPLAYGHNIGTWVSLWADFTSNGQDVSPYNISCSYPDWYDTMYNVLTISGTDLAVTLYAPQIPKPGSSTIETTLRTVDLTLVIRQRWPHTPLANGYQDSLEMPCLTYLDNDMTY